MQSGLDFVEVGQHYTLARTVGEADVALISSITGDFGDTHINDQYMKERSNLGSRVAHGALIVGFMSTVSTISIAQVTHTASLSDSPVTAGLRQNPLSQLGNTFTMHYTVAEADKADGHSSWRKGEPTQ